MISRASLDRRHLAPRCASRPPHLRKPQSGPGAARDGARDALHGGARGAAATLPVVVPPLRADALDDAARRGRRPVPLRRPRHPPGGYGRRSRHPRSADRAGARRLRAGAGARRRPRGTPLLAICRGAQPLNVARGGTLIQHLPRLSRTLDRASPAERGRAPTHAVEIEPDSRLAELLGVTEARVNSFHHQAVDRSAAARACRAVGAGRHRSRRSRTPDRPFVLAVQWHAEYLVERPEHARCSAAFVAAARAVRRAWRAA